MERAGVLCAIASEENADLVRIPDQFPKGDYFLIFDPLDGSSNIDANVNVGTIFSIYRSKGECNADALSDLLQRGSEQVAAGYFLYGPSTMPQGNLQEALQYFHLLQQTFPDTDYGKEAVDYIRRCRKRLAEHDKPQN